MFHQVPAYAGDWRSFAYAFTCYLLLLSEQYLSFYELISEKPQV
jgi:hypothetical protein